MPDARPLPPTRPVASMGPAPTTYPPLRDDHRSRRFAARYDGSLAAVERAFLADVRATLVGDLSGHVVEIGAGTGANLPHYAAAPGIDRVDLVEPLPSMRHLLALRVAAHAAPRSRPQLRVVDGRGERLPYPDASVDAVVATLVLCSVADVAATLREVRRVLRLGGVFAFCEHTAGYGVRRVVQRALTPLAVRHAAGCHYDRDLRGAIAAAGFARVEPVPVVAPWPMRLLPEWPFVAGRAIAA